MSLEQVDINALKEKARQFRKGLLEVITNAGSGHPGGSLSSVEILTSLYYYKMKLDPSKPDWPLRDRFILSKGHVCPILYVILADLGYFPKKELKNFRKINSLLQGHAHTGVPGVELSTGSLGQGLSVANGIALGTRIQKTKFNVYCLLGDGEIQEGQIWEAAMTASHHKVDNVCAILDANGIQENGPVEEIKSEEPLADKWRDFGWHVIEIDGHDFVQIIKALDEFEEVKEKPTFILARTIKGKGVSFMEGQNKWHGKAPNQKQLAEALKELGF